MYDTIDTYWWGIIIEIVSYIGFFIIVAGIASYYNVLVGRGFKKSLTIPSYCDNCQQKLKWWQLIPVISSFIILVFYRGKSICCGSRLQVKQYFVTEILGGLTGLLLTYQFLQIDSLNFSTVTSFVFIVIATLLFLYISVEDIWNYEISFIPTLSLAFLGLLVGVILGVDLLWAGLLFLIVGGSIAAIVYFSKGEGMGSGDIILVAFIAFSLGFRDGIAAILFMIYLTAIIGVLYSYYKKQFKGLLVPLAPFLYLGWIIALSFPEIASWLIGLYTF